MDSYKANLIIENKSVGADTVIVELDLITKTVGQLAHEDAQWTAKQARNARAREAVARREAALQVAIMRAVGAQERAKAWYQIQWAKLVASEKAVAARQAEQVEKQAAQKSIQAAREVARVQAQEAKASRRRSVFGVDTGVDLVNLASGLYTVQTAYRMVAQAASVAMDAIQEAAKWEQYSVAITTMEGSATTAAKSLEDLYQISKAPGIDLEGANKSYLQLRAIGVEGERAKTIIAEFANTVARSGGGGVEFERVNRQLVQMLANGRVLESELKWMKESMPELAKVMQATFGTTSAEGIRKLGIGADEFVTRLTEGLAKLPRAESTMNTSLENMATAWSKFRASIVPMGITDFFLEGVTNELEAFTAIINGMKSPLDLIKQTIDDISAVNDKTAGVTSALLKKMDQAGLSFDQQRYTLYGEGMSAEQGMAMSRATPRNTLTDTQRLEQWSQQPKKPAKKGKTADSAADETASVQNVDYFRAIGQDGREEEMRYRWNASRGGSGKEEAARNRAYAAQLEEKKNALAEIAAVGRSAKEQELVDAAEWRTQMEAAIGDDNAAYLRLEEAYGKKLADINEKYNKQIAEDEKKAQQERLAAMEQFTSGMGSLAGAMGGLILQMNSDNTEAYAAMVAIQQGFAIAQATMNMYVAMSQALTQPFPANLAAVGMVAAAGGQILSAITAMNVAKVGKGAFDRGGTLGYGEWGIAGERGAEIVEGPARITSRRDTASMLRGGGSTSVAVNVHNYAGASVATKQNSDGSIDLIIDKLEERMAEGVYTGSGKMGTAMSRTFGLKRAGR